MGVPTSSPSQGVDPLLLRRFYLNISGVDPGSNPLFMDIPSTVGNIGIVPVIPINNYKEPLYVYNRGWWGGGTVENVGSNGSAQVQTTIKICHDAGSSENITSGSTLTLYTPTAGKAGYITGIYLNVGFAAGPVTTGTIYLYDGSASSTTILATIFGDTGNVQIFYPFTFPIAAAKVATNLTIKNNTASTITISSVIVGWEE